MSFPDSLRALVWDGNAIWGFAAAVGIVLVLTPLIGRYAARIGGVDKGGDRPRVHKAPVPRIGGLAIVAGVLIPAVILIEPDGPYLGILVGTLLGLGLSYRLVEYLGREFPEIVFTIPWGQIGGIALFSYVASMLTTFLPAWQAGRISPAEALRYE